MRYERIGPAGLLERPNRLVAHVLLEGQAEKTVCHVKNTGRCRELLVPGTAVYVQRAANPERKPGYDLICAVKNGNLVNMDSQAPNEAAAEWLAKGHLF